MTVQPFSFCDNTTIGTAVKLIAFPAQTGVVTRKSILGIKQSFVITFNTGPLYTAGSSRLYFCAQANIFELA